MHQNQPDGTVKKTICDICCPSFHCGMDCHVRDGKIVKVEGTADHPVNHGLLCVKGLSARQYLYHPNRIRTPLKRVGPRGSGEFVPISWDEALPGDLVFYPGDEHVGIVGGRDEAGDLLIVHCASSANNVVITGKSGFTSIGRPVYYRE